MAERIITKQEYAAGDRIFNQAGDILDIPADANWILVSVSRDTAWEADPGVMHSVAYAVYLSMDGGSTWMEDPWFGGKGVGGPQTRSSVTGLMMNPGAFTNLPEPGNPNRKARARVVNRKTITTEIKLKTFTTKPNKRELDAGPTG